MKPHLIQGEEKDTVYLSNINNPEMPSYGNSDRFSMEVIADINKGDPSNKCQFSMTNHFGTHVDGPMHFYPEGRSIDSYPPEFWITDKVDIIQIPVDGCSLEENDYLIPFDLTVVPGGDTEALIIKTGYGSLRHSERYWKENPGLHPDWADVLRQYCPRLRFVLIDSISISSWRNREEGRRAHREFLNPDKGSILLVEDADLAGITLFDKIRELFVFPLLIGGVDSAPVTVIARLSLSLNQQDISLGQAFQISGGNLE